MEVPLKTMEPEAMANSPTNSSGVSTTRSGKSGGKGQGSRSDANATGVQSSGTSSSGGSTGGTTKTS